MKNNTKQQLKMFASGYFEILGLWVIYRIIANGYELRDIIFSTICGGIAFFFPMWFDFFLYNKVKTLRKLKKWSITALSPLFVLFFNHLGDKYLWLTWDLKATLIDLFVTFCFLYVLFYAAFVYRTLGERAIWAFYSGKYIHPVEENKVVMFLDITSSTTIAEAIGHKKFLSLLNEFFYDISDEIIRYNGDIYKYVGDEIIILWDYSNIKGNEPVKFFESATKIVRKNKKKYMDKYGVENLDFKAALHAGAVIVGELGKYNKEIAFIGDTLNTTARVEGECNKHKKRLMVTGDYVELLNQNNNNKYELEFNSMGKIKLRGKDREMEILSMK